MKVILWRWSNWGITFSSNESMKDQLKESTEIELKPESFERLLGYTMSGIQERCERILRKKGLWD